MSRDSDTPIRVRAEGFLSIQLSADVDSKRLTIVRGPQARPGRVEPEGKAFARAVREGLTARPRTLPFAYFYDETGSALFEQICALPEYYLTRTEDAILREHAPAMTAGWHEPPTLVELGSGSAEKTRRLIASAVGHYGRLHYVPIDVSESAIEASARELVGAFPTLHVTGHVGDYHAGLGSIVGRLRGPKFFLFLGSSLGNYEPESAAELLGKVAGLMGPEDRFLLGTDLVKDAASLEAAYDDAQGVTARFNLNLLARINRELGGDFAPDGFRHRAVYRPDLCRVEMHLVSQADQTVHVPAASLTAFFTAGESIHTENSHKYTAESLRALAAQAGLVEEAAWVDEKGWFRVQRWRNQADRKIRADRPEL